MPYTYRDIRTFLHRINDAIRESEFDRQVGIFGLQLIDQMGDMEPAKPLWRIDLYQSPDTGVSMGELIGGVIQQFYSLTYLRIVALPLLGEFDGTRAPVKELLSQFPFLRRNES